jgi:hypothetical protein
MRIWRRDIGRLRRLPRLTGGSFFDIVEVASCQRRLPTRRKVKGSHHALGGQAFPKFTELG